MPLNDTGGSRETVTIETSMGPDGPMMPTRNLSTAATLASSGLQKTVLCAEVPMNGSTSIRATPKGSVDRELPPQYPETEPCHDQRVSSPSFWDTPSPNKGERRGLFSNDPHKRWSAQGPVGAHDHRRIASAYTMAPQRSNSGPLDYDSKGEATPKSINRYNMDFAYLGCGPSGDVARERKDMYDTLTKNRRDIEYLKVVAKDLKSETTAIHRDLQQLTAFQKDFATAVISELKAVSGLIKSISLRQDAYISMFSDSLGAQDARLRNTEDKADRLLSDKIRSDVMQTAGGDLLISKTFKKGTSSQGQGSNSQVNPDSQRMSNSEFTTKTVTRSRHSALH